MQDMEHDFINNLLIKLFLEPDIFFFFFPEVFHESLTHVLFALQEAIDKEKGDSINLITMTMSKIIKRWF